MARRNERSGCMGCMGCATVLALIAAIVVAIALHYAPPVIRNVAAAYSRRVSDTLGIPKSDQTTQAEGAGAAGTTIGYAGQLLSERQQAVYEQMLNEATAFSRSFAVFEASPEDIDPAYKAIIRDHPELFWLDGSCKYTYSKIGDVVSVELGLNMELEGVPEMKSRIEAVADELMSDVPADASAYEVAKAAYEKVITTTDYDVNASQNQNIQSVFLGRSSVCAGYARAYQYLLQRRGVPCAYVEGTITTTGEDHAWNLVQIGDAYAYVDVTWGDPTYAGEGSDVPLDSIIYDYFCLTTAEITRDGHAFAAPDAWPVCDYPELDYYHTAGLFYETYDASEINSSFLSQLQAHPGSAYFKFANDEAYLQANVALSEGTFARDQLLQIAMGAGSDSIVYRYATSDTLRIVKVYW